MKKLTRRERGLEHKAERIFSAKPQQPAKEFKEIQFPNLETKQRFEVDKRNGALIPLSY